ncbi:MAG: AAA family ATPase [Planctomycetota bacterium]
MLIRSLRAENFMRFESLKLENLPCTGLGGVEGPNESGKSTIADAILYALFGKSRRGRQEAGVLIRWGAHRMFVELEVELESSGGEGGESTSTRYFISREVDRLGSHFARVEELSTGTDVARGVLEVRKFVAERVPFTSTEFEDAFCRSQYEHEYTTDRLVDFVDRLCGISYLERAKARIEREVIELEREFVLYQKDIGRHMKQAQRYASSSARIEELERALEAARAQIEAEEIDQKEREANLQTIRNQVSAVERLEKRVLQAGNARQSQVADTFGEVEESYEKTLRPFDDASAEATELESSRSRVRELRAAFDAAGALRSKLNGAASHLKDELDSSNSGLEGRRRSLANSLDQLKKDREGSKTPLVVCAIGAALTFAGSAAVVLVPDVRAVIEPSGVESMASAVVGSVLALLGSILLALALRTHSRRSRLATESDQRAIELEGATREVEEARRAAKELRKVLDEHDSEIDLAERASKLSDPSLRSAGESFSKEHSAVISDAPKGASPKGKAPKGKKGNCWSRNFSQLAKREKKLRETLQSRRDELAKESKDASAGVKKLRSDRDRQENDLRECRVHLEKMNDLNAQREELESKAAAVRSSMDDRRLAQELLATSAESIRAKIRPTLVALLQKILPRVTSGRYRDVRIDESMRIQVYSPERSDFVAPTELSGGTNEALLLALRLVFAQAFVSARGLGRQFIILDEPFRMLDGERASAALEVLKDLSRELSQLIVLQPEFRVPQRELFESRVVSSLGDARLEVDFLAVPNASR